MQATGKFLRRSVWAWPIIAAVILGAAGWSVHRVVEHAMHEQRAAELNVMADAGVAAVEAWMTEQRKIAELYAQDEQMQTLVEELLKIADAAAKDPADVERRLVQSPAQNSLRARLKPRLASTHHVGYFVVSPQGVVVAADQDAPVGKQLAGYRQEIYARALAGKSLVSKPFPSPLLLPDAQGELRTNLPTMFTIAPLRDGTGRGVAALGLRIRPEEQFTRILETVRFGDSGETYAFDSTGLMLSASRFDEQLKEIGLLVDRPEARSILTVEVRDPGVNMAAGERPALRRPEQPLTRMAADAVLGHNGVDADGYRGYRGIPKVGAWRWLPEYDFGITTEVDSAEAFLPVILLRRAFWSLMGLLGLSAIGIFFAMRYIARQQRALQTATLTAKQLGQYALEDKLGAGGMGTVYRARHAMLRRPTAVKLLDLDKISDTAMARFEREVQLTSGLSHPNTVAIFDYGRTDDGIFYYAMEYLEGLNLDDLVKKYGPLGEARTLHILRQLCGSLAEAHAAGLVHRDIKPANIFLTRRGGLCDFVKVLDFGLVKARDGVDQAGVTSPNALMGTPLYLSPEGVTAPDEVDARADVYAVGAVGYFLLTGTPVFDGATLMEICLKHTSEPPQPPSARLGKRIDPQLEALLMSCLEKEKTSRPNDAGDLLRRLEAIAPGEKWSWESAAIWWQTQAGIQNATTAADITMNRSSLEATQAAGSPPLDRTSDFSNR